MCSTDTNTVLYCTLLTNNARQTISMFLNVRKPLSPDISLVLVGMVKQPSEHSSEFQMSNEDFPALPGAPASFVFSDQSGVLDSVKINAAQLTPEQELAKSAQARKGIQTSPNGESSLLTSLVAIFVFNCRL